MRTAYFLPLAAALALLVGGQAAAEAEDDRVVTFSFQDQDVRDVIVTIAEFAEANVILSPKVQGKVTLRLRDVPWRQGLEQVARAVGAKIVEEEHGILRVLPAVETEDLQLLYYRVEDLLATHPDLLDKLPTLTDPKAIELHDSVLVVRANPIELRRVSATLDKLRADLGVPSVEGPIKVPPGPPPPPATVVQPTWPKPPTRPSLEEIERRLDTRKITVLVMKPKVEDVLGVLSRTLGVPVFAAPMARDRMQGTPLRPVRKDQVAREVLDHVAETTGTKWAVVPSGVIVLGPEESAEGRFVLEGTDPHHVEVGIDFLRDVTTPTAPPKGLAEHLEALRKEIRALRREVNEIKALLLR